MGGVQRKEAHVIEIASCGGQGLVGADATGSSPVRQMSAKDGAKVKPSRSSRGALQGVKSDTMFPRIQRAVTDILASGKVVTPIDVLIRMQLLKPDQVEDWRFGRIPYLEGVINCNLAKLGRILRILRAYALDMKLKPSHTAYCRWGKRGHKAPLRFSKSGDRKVEEAYSCHFVRQGAQLANEVNSAEPRRSRTEGQGDESQGGMGPGK